MSSAASALRDAVVRLKAAGVPGAARDGRLLLAQAMSIEPGRLTLHLPDRLEPAQEAAFGVAIARRCAREPVSHILGWRDFFGRRFQVGPDVLDPRPETETLIATALQGTAQRVLDLGTGSGCILLTLLAEWPQATGLGVDLSKGALGVARANAAALGLTQRSQFQLGDWGRGLAGPFDLIVSNPPYIGADELAALAPDVTRHEPYMALSPGADALLAYRQICPTLLRLLSAEGRVLFEIGPTQASAVSELLKAEGFLQVSCIQDLDGRDRVIAAQSA